MITLSKRQRKTIEATEMNEWQVGVLAHEITHYVNGNQKLFTQEVEMVMGTAVIIITYGLENSIINQHAAIIRI